MHIPSGMAGISIVLFALMGTIGVGYLLNGNTTYEPVDTYDYVTDVTGLYNYTPVTAYAPYLPAANNYQYSTSIEDLGTYTSGINYTEAGAANLNPIITPDSGTHTETVTIAYADLIGTESELSSIVCIQGLSQSNDNIPCKIIPLQALVNSLGTYNEISISMPNTAENYTYPADNNGQGQYITITPNFQTVGIVYNSSGSYTNEGLIDAINEHATAAKVTSGYKSYTNSTISIEYLVGYQYPDNTPNTITCTSIPVGIISDFTIQSNGTVTYAYTRNGSIETVTSSIDSLQLIVYGDNAYMPDYTAGLTYTRTYSTDVNYLDPNYGVSTSANTVYWNNGNDLGSVAILLKKPTNTTSQTFTMYHADNTAALAYTISYNGMTWTISSSGTTVNMGKGWEGILVTAYYTGELQWTPVKQFTNFTDYRLGNTNTIAAAVEGNEPISYCAITSQAQSFNFAVVGTSVASGSVPGAMYNATFTVTDYFPQYDDVRVNFDSAAYVGTSVQVGTWTMNVDSASFIGTFTGADGAERRADLTKPWAIIWTTADTVAVSYTPYNKMGTQTVTVLSADAAKVVTLNGQWVLDTDLYSISTHEEPVYNWNFGHWGLDKIPFIVCVMGLTAVLAIIYRITGVPFSGFDFAIIALANLVLWVIM